MVILLTPQPKIHRTAEENLGIGYLASALRNEGHQVKIIDSWLLGMNNSQILEQIFKAGQVTAIGISCYKSSLDEVKELIQLLRSSGITASIIAGGYGPSFFPNDFLSAGCDFVIKGEAEKTLVGFIKALVAKKSISIVNERDRIINGEFSDDLDNLSFPARDTISRSITLFNPISISTSRGCRGNCKFCSIKAFVKQAKVAPWRGRSVDNIVDEIESLYKEYQVDCFKIVDDSFLEPPRDLLWVKKFVLELERRHLAIRFRTQIRADRLNKEIVETMARAGWFATSIGIENGSKTALERMGKRATYEDNCRALELLESYGIYTQMGMILFDNQTSMLELQENLEFLEKQKWVTTKGIFTEMFAAKDTLFTIELERQGFLKPGTEGNNGYDLQDASVAIVYRSLKQWHKSHAEIYDHVVNPICVPKVLPSIGYDSYHQLCRQLYDQDISFFSQLLEKTSSGFSEDKIGEFTQKEIERANSWYESVEQHAQSLDRTYNISYDAILNPFL